MASRYEGPLRIFRIADIRHAIFDGGGAAQFGGRWNSPGHRAIYGALSFAGAMLERIAQSGIGKIPSRQRWITIDIPNGIEIEEIVARDVPRWNAADLGASRAYGERWLEEKRTVALITPSVVGWPHERNAVINQDHPGFSRLVASDPQPVRWDPRLAGGQRKTGRTRR